MNTPDDSEGSRKGTDVSGTSGGRRLAAETLARLRSALPDRPGALEFARAVALHLSHPPGGPGSPAAEHDAAERVLRLLRSPGGPPEAARLAADPALLASVFQNVDLLHAHADPGADSLALLVMSALEFADRSGR